MCHDSLPHVVTLSQDARNISSSKQVPSVASLWPWTKWGWKTISNINANAEKLQNWTVDAIALLVPIYLCVETGQNISQIVKHLEKKNRTYKIYLLYIVQWMWRHDAWLKVYFLEFAFKAYYAWKWKDQLRLNYSLAGSSGVVGRSGKENSPCAASADVMGVAAAQMIEPDP